MSKYFHYRHKAAFVFRRYLLGQIVTERFKNGFNAAAQQRVLVGKVLIESSTAYICPVNNFLYGNVGVFFFTQQIA